MKVLILRSFSAIWPSSVVGLLRRGVPDADIGVPTLFKSGAANEVLGATEAASSVGSTAANGAASSGAATAAGACGSAGGGAGAGAGSEAEAGAEAGAGAGAASWAWALAWALAGAGVEARMSLSAQAAHQLPPEPRLQL